MKLYNKEWGKILKEHGLDALIATTPENVFYASGYQSLNHWRHPTYRTYALIKNDGEVTLILPAGSVDAVFQQKSRISDIRTYGNFFINLANYQSLDTISHSFLESLKKSNKEILGIEVLARELELHNYNIVGLDEQHITFQEWDALQKKLPKVQFIKGYQLWRKLRMVKNENEIKIIERATHIAEDGLMSAVNSFRKGCNEIEAEIAFKTTVVRQGAIPTFCQIGSGKRGAWPNPIPILRTPLPGEPIRMDAGCIYKGYHSDEARTAIKKPVSGIIKDKYSALEAGVEAGMKKLRAGVTADIIFSTVVKTIQESGIPGYKRHHVGHGEGVEGYDIPLLAPNVKDTLEAGSVICLETPYYELGLGGLQIENAIVITEKGYRLLSKLPNDLIEL